METLRNLSAADELGIIREEMKRRRAREAKLRTAMLEAGGAPAGATFRVEIAEQHRRTFDRAALPSAIADDPRYWRETTVRVVRTIPVEDGGASLIDDEDS